MAITVTFSTCREVNGEMSQEPIGKIVWDGSKFSYDPKTMGYRIARPMYDPEKDEQVDARKDPERWMELLQYFYDSPYHLASPPENEEKGD